MLAQRADGAGSRGVRRTVLLTPTAPGGVAAAPRRVVLGALVGSGGFAKVLRIKGVTRRVMRLVAGEEHVLQRELRGLELSQLLYSRGAAVQCVWSTGRFRGSCVERRRRSCRTDVVAAEGVYGEIARFDLDLFDYLDAADHGSVAMTEFLAFAIRLLRTTRAVHDHGWIHNDVKPENVGLWRINGRARVDTAVLIDFGHATPIGESAPCTGSPAYLPPECNPSASPPFPEGYDPRAKDAFALGVTLLLAWYTIVRRVPSQWHFEFGSSPEFQSGRQRRIERFDRFAADRGSVGAGGRFEYELLRLVDPDWQKRPLLSGVCAIAQDLLGEGAGASADPERPSRRVATPPGSTRGVEASKAVGARLVNPGVAAPPAPTSRAPNPIPIRTKLCRSGVVYPTPPLREADDSSLVWRTALRRWACVDERAQQASYGAERLAFTSLTVRTKLRRSRSAP